MIPSQPLPYIGLTGAVTRDDVDIIRDASLMVLGDGDIYTLMAGVLVSHKTISGRSTTNRRYPTVDAARDLIPALKATDSWVVAHYNDSGCKDPLFDQLQRVHQALPGIEGIQMNIVRPDPEEVRKYRDHYGFPLILQVNSRSLEDPKDADEVLRYVDRYRGLVSYALLDLSGGQGKDLDPVWGKTILDRWTQESILPGVAGGLGAGCEAVLQALSDERCLMGVCTDAEGKTRVPVSDPIPDEKYQDQMSRDASIGYVRSVLTATGC